MPYAAIGYICYENLNKMKYHLVDEFMNSIMSYSNPAYTLFQEKKKDSENRAIENIDDDSVNNEDIFLGKNWVLGITLTGTEANVTPSQENSIKIKSKIRIPPIAYSSLKAKVIVQHAFKSLSILQGIEGYSTERDTDKKLNMDKYIQRHDYSCIRLSAVVLNAILIAVVLIGRTMSVNDYYFQKVTEYSVNFVARYAYFEDSMFVKTSYKNKDVILLKKEVLMDFLMTYTEEIGNPASSLNNRPIHVGNSIFLQFRTTPQIIKDKLAFQLQTSTNTILNQDMRYDYQYKDDEGQIQSDPYILKPTNDTECLSNLKNRSYIFHYQTTQTEYDIYGVNIDAIQFGFYSDVSVNYSIDLDALSKMSSIILFFTLFPPEIDKFTFGISLMENTFTGTYQFHLLKANSFIPNFYEKDRDINYLCGDILILIFSSFTLLTAILSLIHILRQNKYKVSKLNESSNTSSIPYMDIILSTTQFLFIIIRMCYLGVLKQSSISAFYLTQKTVLLIY